MALPHVPDHCGTPHTAHSIALGSSAVPHFCDLTDRYVLDSPCPSCSGGQDSVVLVPCGPTMGHPDPELQDWTLTGPEGDEGREHLPQIPSMYHRMMDYITLVFKDAKGMKIRPEGPIGPGTDATPE